MANPMVSAARIPALAKNARTGHPDSRMGKEKLTVNAGRPVGPESNQDFWIGTLQVAPPREVARSGKRNAAVGMTRR
jgi:hypothetical protein